MASKKTTRKKSTTKKVTEPKQKVSITDILNKKKVNKSKQESKEKELSKQNEGTLPSKEEVKPDVINEEVESEPISEAEPILEHKEVETDVINEEVESDVFNEEEPSINDDVETDVINEEVKSETNIEEDPIINDEVESTVINEEDPINEALESETINEAEPIDINEEVESEPEVINEEYSIPLGSDVLINEGKQDDFDDVHLDGDIQGLVEPDLLNDSIEDEQTKQELLDSLDKLEELSSGNLDDILLDDLDEDPLNSVDSVATITIDEVIQQENNGKQTRLSDLGDDQHITTLIEEPDTIKPVRKKPESRQVIEAKAPEGRQPKRKAPQPEGKPRRQRPVDREGQPVKRKRTKSNAQGIPTSQQNKPNKSKKVKKSKKALNVKGVLPKKQVKVRGPVQTIKKDGQKMQIRKAVRRKKRTVDKKLSALMAGILVVVTMIVIGVKVFGRGVDSVDYQVVNQSETMQQIAQETFGKKYIEDLNARPIAYFETQHNRILAGYLATLEHYLKTGEGKNHLEVETVRLYNNLEYIYAKANDKYIKNKQAGDTSDLIKNYERNNELMQSVFGGNLKSFAVRVINGYNDIPALQESLGVSSNAELLQRISTITNEMFSVYYSYVLNNPQPEIEQTIPEPSE